MEGDFDDAPDRLEANARKAFIGSYLLGMGFTFDDAAALKGDAEPISKMEKLTANNPHNAGRIKPYIGGEEVNSSPTHAYHRYAIDFEDFPLRRDPTATYPWRQLSEETQKAKLRSGIVSADFPNSVAADWPDLLEIVDRLVRPERSKNPDRSRREIWWRYTRRAPGLSRAIENVSYVLACSRVSPQLGITRLPSTMVFADSLVVFAFSTLQPLAVLQSRVHEIWARFFSSSMKDDLRYAPSDCFETFPFPEGYGTDEALEQVGQTYHDYRAALMIDANEGMTKTYNRFHNDEERGASIQRLRELHDEMDRAVLRAYGWHDLADELRPEFLSDETEDDHTYQGRYFWSAEGRDLVLSRLLALNSERHAEEVRMGVAPESSTRADEDDELK